jgi:hypothetical protein
VPSGLFVVNRDFTRYGAGHSSNFVNFLHPRLGRDEIRNYDYSI